MGSNSTFKINDDGSATMTNHLSDVKQNIIDILQIEKSKGGVLANRRMKKRALRYAKSVNYPEFKVDKLMLDYYPEEFSSQEKTNIRLTALILSVIFLLCGVICGISVIALLADNFDYYIHFSGPDFPLLVVGSIAGIILGLCSLKWYKSLESKNHKSIK